MDIPSVVDTARQTRIESLTGAKSFSIFNIVSLIVIALAIFFLYKRYKDKNATTTAHMMRPSPIIPPTTVGTAPVTVEEVDDETKAD